MPLLGSRGGDILLGGAVGPSCRLSVHMFFQPVLSGTAVYSPNAKPTNSIQWQRSIRK